MFTLLIPIQPLGSWIGFTMLSVCSVAIFYLLGKYLYGTLFAILCALIAAFSASEIYNAPDMLNPMAVSFFVVTAFYFLARLLKGKKIVHSILFGFTLGLAINFHLQALGLLLLIPLTLLFIPTIKQELITILSMMGGLVTAFIPLIIYDLNHNFAWVISLFNYFTGEQNKFSTNYTLISDIGKFWPQFLGNSLVFIPGIGYFLLAVFLGCVIILRFRKSIKIGPFIWIIGLTFLLQIPLLNIYKGPRLPGYLVSYHPFVIFLTAFSILTFWKLHKAFGISILMVILAVSTYSDWKIVIQKTQNSIVFNMKNSLPQNSSLEIYSYPSSFTFSLPLYYLLETEGKVTNDGKKIGVCLHSIQRSENLVGYSENCPPGYPLIAANNEYMVYDLNADQEEKLINKGLFKVTPENINKWIYKNYPE